MRADQPLVLARDRERLLGLVAQRAGRFEIELGAAQLVLDARGFAAGLRARLPHLAVGVLQRHVAEAAVVEGQRDRQRDRPRALVDRGRLHRVVVAGVGGERQRGEELGPGVGLEPRGDLFVGAGGGHLRPHFERPGDQVLEGAADLVGRLRGQSELEGGVAAVEERGQLALRAGIVELGAAGLLIGAEVIDARAQGGRELDEAGFVAGLGLDGVIAGGLGLAGRDRRQLFEGESGVVGGGDAQEQLAALLGLGQAGDVDLLVGALQRWQRAQVEDVPVEAERALLRIRAGVGDAQARVVDVGAGVRVMRERAGRGQRGLHRRPGALDVVLRLRDALEGDGEVGRLTAHFRERLRQRKDRTFRSGLRDRVREGIADRRLRRRFDGTDRLQRRLCQEEKGDHGRRKVFEARADVNRRCPPCAKTSAPARRGRAGAGRSVRPISGRRCAASRWRGRLSR